MGMMVCTDCESLPFKIRYQKEDGQLYSRTFMMRCVVILFCCFKRSGPIPQWLPTSIWLITHHHAGNLIFAHVSV